MGDDMKSIARFFLLLILIFINFNCNKKVTSTQDKPGPVTLVPGVEDTCRVEKGIDAIPEGNLIRIEWMAGDASTARYKVFRGTDPKGLFTLIITEDVSVQFYEDQVPSLTVRYYYFVRTVNDEGVESDPSDTLSYRLIRKAEGLDPVDPCGNRPSFTWRDPNSPQANDYIIRVRETGSGRMVWLSKFRNMDFGPDTKTIAFDADGGALSDSLASGAEYQWRIDIVGNEKNSGSESSWTTIQIQ
jgi:hypothetical protein